MLIESLKVLANPPSRKGGRTYPGQEIELSDDDGHRLLTKAPDAVRQVFDALEVRITSTECLRITDAPKGDLSNKSIEISPAASGAKPVYWETGTGQILGPAVPEFLMRDRGAFWIVMTFRGQIRWINADRLRTKKMFDAQVLR